MESQDYRCYRKLLPYTLMLSFYMIPLYVISAIYFPQHKARYESEITNISVVLICFRTAFWLTGIFLTILFKARTNGYQGNINNPYWVLFTGFLLVTDLITSIIYFIVTKFLYEQPDPIVIMLSLPFITFSLIFGFVIVYIVVFSLLYCLSYTYRNCAEFCSYLCVTPSIGIVLAQNVNEPNIILNNIQIHPLNINQCTSYETLVKMNKRSIEIKCSICLKEFTLNEKLTLLRCSHYFHINCVNAWFQTNVNKPCPLCRVNN